MRLLLTIDDRARAAISSQQVISICKVQEQSNTGCLSESAEKTLLPKRIRFKAKNAITKVELEKMLSLGAAPALGAAPL